MARIEHLLGRYGVLTEELLTEIERRPELAEVLPGTDDHLKVEVWYAAHAEAALHLDDVLARRTRLSIQTFDRGLAAAEPAARIMAEVLDWDEERIEHEIALYRGRVDAERRSQETKPPTRSAAACPTPCGERRLMPLRPGLTTCAGAGDGSVQRRGLIFPVYATRPTSAATPKCERMTRSNEHGSVPGPCGGSRCPGLVAALAAACAGRIRGVAGRGGDHAAASA